MTSSPSRSVSLVTLCLTLAGVIACGGGEVGSGQDGITADDDIDSGNTTPVAQDSGALPPAVEKDAGAPLPFDAGDPSDASGDAANKDGGAGDGGTGTLGAKCTKDSECSMAFPICNKFNQKGRLCTKRCKKAEECPAPSTGCGGNGVCKVP